MATFSSEGIILKRVDFGEADRLITIFTKNKGKITSIAKGIRRIKSRRGGHVDLLNKAKLFFAESKGLPILTEAEVINTYKNLKNDLKKVGHAYYLAELTHQFFQDQQNNYKVYDILSESLGLLDTDSKDKAENIVRSFEIKILNFAGYSPQLFRCIKCRSKLLPTENFLSPEAGGILDKSCANGSFLIKPISPEAIKLMRFSHEKSINETVKVNISDKLMSDLKSQMKFYLEYILEKQLTSANFLEKVNNLE